MTEDEAKTKWCPMVRHAVQGEGSFNRGVSTDDPCNHSIKPSTDWSCACIASDCMMWVEDYRKVIKMDELQCDLYAAGDKNMPNGGHCGLAK